MSTAVQARTAAVTITPAGLRKAVRWVKSLQGPPAHGAVRVTITGSQLVMAACDFETVRLVSLDLSAAGEQGVASVLVPADTLEEMVKALPDGTRQVEVRVHDLTMADLTADPGTVKAHRVSVARVNCDYPQLPPAPAPVGLVDGSAFKAAAGRVAVAASARTELPWLTCVRMQAEADGLWLSATDRYKITVEPVPWAVLPASEGSWLFPAREIRAFTGVAAGMACLLADQGNMVGLTDGTWTVLTYRVKADPVDVRSFILNMQTRQPLVGQVTVDAKSLARLLEVPARIKGTSDVNPPYVVMATSAGQDGLSLHLERAAEPWTASFPAAVDGGQLTAAWNPGYLAGLLGVLDGQVVIHLASPGPDGRVLNPVKITCAAHPRWTGVLAVVDSSK